MGGILPAAELPVSFAVKELFERLGGVSEEMRAVFIKTAWDDISIPMDHGGVPQPLAGACGFFLAEPAAFQLPVPPIAVR